MEQSLRTVEPWKTANDPFVDPVLESAMKFAESLARNHLHQNGDLVDLFATFVGMVVQDDSRLGLCSLKMLDEWRPMLFR